MRHLLSVVLCIVILATAPLIVTSDTVLIRRGGAPITVAYDNSNACQGTSTGTFDCTLTAAGTDRMAYVLANAEPVNCSAITGVTYDGSAATEIAVINTADIRAKLYRVVPSTTSSAVVRMSTTGTCTAGMCVISLTGVSAGTPNDAVQSSTGTTAPSVTLTGDSGDMGVDFLHVKNTVSNTITMGAQTNRVQRQNLLDNPNTCAMSTDPDPGTMNWSWATPMFAQLWGLNVNHN